MSYQLQRGQNISLTKLAASITRAAVGLGWDASNGGTPVNLDTSAFMLGANGKVLSDAHFIFFNQLTSPDGAVEHQGNNTTGVGAGDDELININLPQVAQEVEKIVFTVTIYDDNQNFGMVSNAYIRVVNLSDQQEILRYNLTEQFSNETAMVFGELYRYKGEWKFRAVGQGYAGGLQAMADTYGVSTDDEPAAEPTPTATTTPPPATPVQPTPSQAPAVSPSATSQAAPTFSMIKEVSSGLKTGITGLKYELLYPGAYTALKVHLKPNEEVKAESGAMVAMEGTVDVAGKMEGGILGGMARTFLTGESFFFQKLVAQRGAGWAMIGQPALGDIAAVDMDGSYEYILQKDGFLAATDGLSVSTKLQNLFQGLGSGEGFFVIKISGNGTLFMSSYGAIHPIDIPAGEEFIVDNHHLVAWPSTVHYSVELASGFSFSSLTSGEMLVCRFRGPGRIFIQSRSPAGFVGWLAQFAPDLFPEQAVGATASTASNVLNTVSNLID